MPEIPAMSFATDGPLGTHGVREHAHVDDVIADELDFPLHVPDALEQDGALLDLASQRVVVFLRRALVERNDVFGARACERVGDVRFDVVGRGACCEDLLELREITAHFADGGCAVGEEGFFEGADGGEEVLEVHEGLRSRFGGLAAFAGLAERVELLA